MCLAAIIGGSILPPFRLDAGAFVNTENDLTLLEKNVLPEVTTIYSRWQYNYQQNGTPYVGFKKCLDFFRRNFSEE